LRFLIDVDGTLYDMAAAIRFLQARAIPFLLVTNTTRIGEPDILLRRRAGGITVAPECIVAAPQAACPYLRAKRPVCCCFVIGSPALDAALCEVGLRTVRTELAVDLVVISHYQWIDFRELASPSA
jgi:ribonucleotide monophosphatase NagD (HAD superfamily)